MSYSKQCETEKAIYRLFRMTHGVATMEGIITPERFQTLDGIVSEVTGDETFHSPPDYDPFKKQWIKTEYGLELIRDTFSKEHLRNIGQLKRKIKSDRH